MPSARFTLSSDSRQNLERGAMSRAKCAEMPPVNRENFRDVQSFGNRHNDGINKINVRVVSIGGEFRRRVCNLRRAEFQIHILFQSEIPKMSPKPRFRKIS